MKRHCIDHNITLVALAYVGGITHVDDVTNQSKTSNPEFEWLRVVVNEVRAGNAALVYSDEMLAVLRDHLIMGGGDFEALDVDSANQAVAVLKALSVASHGFVTRAQVRAAQRHTDAATRAWHGPNKGQVCLEDRGVIAAAFAGGWDGVVISSQDGGIYNCQSSLTNLGGTVVRLKDLLSRRILKVA